MASRDNKMALNSAKVIECLGGEVSVTFIVGNDYIPGIYNRIKKNSPKVL